MIGHAAMFSPSPYANRTISSRLLAASAALYQCVWPAPCGTRLTTLSQSSGFASDMSLALTAPACACATAPQAPTHAPAEIRRGEAECVPRSADGELDRRGPGDSDC